MSLIDAIGKSGIQPIGKNFSQAQKKAYAEKVSYHLAREVAQSLRGVGFDNVHPALDGPGEKAFQGGLGPKKLDVTHSDERNGLLLAISIKTITAEPYGKNLTNRFADLCTESINMHMRFPYSVICALFAFPAPADTDITKIRKESTFRRATKLFSNLTGRYEYTDAAEKFENVTMMLFEGPTKSSKGWVKLIDSHSGKEVSEADYFLRVREIFKHRNPHLLAKELDLDGNDE